MVQAVLVRSAVTSHAGLVEHITHTNPAWSNPAVASAFDLRPPGRRRGARRPDHPAGGDDRLHQRFSTDVVLDARVHPCFCY